MASRSRSQGSMSSVVARGNSLTGGGVPSSLWAAYVALNPNSPVITSSSPAVGTLWSGQSKVTVDKTSPGYFHALRHGGVFPDNPFSSITQYCSGQQQLLRAGYFWQNNAGTSSSYYRTKAVLPDGPPVVAPYPWQGAVTNEAISQARDQAADISTLIAEMDKTVSLFAQSLRLFIEVTDQIRHKQQLGHLPGDIAEAWLAYRYGWRPLIRDIEDVQTALNRALAGKAWLARGHATGEKHYTSSWSGWTTVGCAQFRTKTATETECKGYACIKMQADEAARLDPLVTAYELMKYGFVLDWFFNVGSMISALSPFATGNLIASGTTTLSRAIVDEVQVRLHGVPSLSAAFLRDSYLDAPKYLSGMTISNVRVPSGAKLQVARGSGLNLAKVVDLMAILVRKSKLSF